MKWFIATLLGILSGLLIAAFLLTGKAEAADCNKHKIYCRIVKLQPKVNKQWAMKLSNYIYKYSNIYKIDTDLVTAMLMQESSYIYKHRKVTGLERVETCDDKGFCTEELIEKTIYTDFGPFQFSYYTTKRYKIDPIRLENDLHYATKWFFKFLSGKIKTCKHLGSEAWSCYHSSTPRYREKYVIDVKRFLK